MIVLSCLGPDVQSITKLLTNVTLKDLEIGKYIDIFAEKMWVACYLHFCSKAINVFENALATTVYEFVINKLVKLTMLWTTGPW